MNGRSEITRKFRSNKRTPSDGLLLVLLAQPLRQRLEKLQNGSGFHAVGAAARQRPDDVGPWLGRSHAEHLAVSNRKTNAVRHRRCSGTPRQGSPQ